MTIRGAQAQSDGDRKPVSLVRSVFRWMSSRKATAAIGALFAASFFGEEAMDCIVRESYGIEFGLFLFMIAFWTLVAIRFAIHGTEERS